MHLRYSCRILIRRKFTVLHVVVLVACLFLFYAYLRLHFTHFTPLVKQRSWAPLKSMLTQRLSVDAARKTFGTAACVVARRFACSVLHHQIFRRQWLAERPSAQTVSVIHTDLSLLLGNQTNSACTFVVLCCIFSCTFIVSCLHGVLRLSMWMSLWII